MYEPNYKKIKAQQDAEASIMAANLFQLVKEQTRAEIVERRKDKVVQLGDDIVETIKACFWRGFYNGTQDAKTDISNLTKQKGKKADLASTFSFSNFTTNALDVIEFESEEEKLRKEIAEIEKKLGQFRSLLGKTETPLQKQLREKKEQLAKITPVKLIDQFTDREKKINELKADIKRIENNPGYAANVRQMQDEIKGLQRSNAKIRKEVPNIEELAAERLMAKATEIPEEKSKKRRGKNKLLSDVPDVTPSLPKNLRENLKPKRERIRNNDPRVQAILTPEIRGILAKSEIERTREEQVKLNKAELELGKLGKSFFRENEVTTAKVTQKKRAKTPTPQKNKYRIERDKLEKLAQEQPVGYNPKKDKPEQALKRSIYRMEDKRNRERFITLNTEYPSLFDNDPETNSFFQRYLNQRALTISEGLKKSQEEQIKSMVVGFASDTGVSGKGVIELIQKNLKDPKQAVAVDRLSKRMGSKRDGLRLTNAEYLERYQEWTGKATQSGRNQVETIQDPNEKRFAELIAKEQRGIELSDAEFEELDNLEQLLPQRRQDQLANLITQPTEKFDTEKLTRLRQLAKDNPNGLANFDRTRRATLTPVEIKALKDTIGEKAFNWATYKAEVGPNGELLLNSAHLLKLQQKLDQVGLNNDVKLMQHATSIATTEISAAYNLGRLQVYLDNGVRYVQYTATLDDKTTVFCKSLHLKIYPLNELLVQSFTRTFFPNTDEPEYSPSNRQLAMRESITFWMPPAHISCRSFLLPIYTDDVREKIEQNAKYKLAVSEEIEKSSLNRSLRKGKGKQRGVDSARLDDIISKQSRQNQFLTRKSIEELGDFADLFTNGYRFIVNKIRERATRSEDGKLILEPDDIKNNDRKLTTLLLGSGMVLGFGAMLYFFAKSNLAGALRNYITTTLGKKAADATAAEVATTLGAIDSVINTIPKGLRDQLVDEATPDIPLPDLSKLARTPDPSGELVALARQTQNIEDYISALNSLSETELMNLLGARGLTELEIRRVGIQAVVNRINQNIKGNIVPQYEAMVKAALGNNKGLAGGLDLRSVREIQVFSPDALQVKFKPGFGSPTLLSRRRLQSVMKGAGRREFLQQMREQVNEEIALLDKWAENLKASGNSEQSVIDRGFIVKTRKELAEIQAGLDGFANNFEYFSNIDYDSLPQQLWGDVKRQFGSSAVSEIERATANIYEGQMRLDQLANRLRSDFDNLREFDPGTYGRNFFENFNIDSFRQNLIREARRELDNLLTDPLAKPEDIAEFREYLQKLISNPGTYELPELKALEAQVNNSIKQVNTNYIGQNRPYELRVASRRLAGGNGEAEYNTIRQSIEEASNVMRVYGEGENVPTVVRNVNESYRGYIESRYNQMLDVQQQIRDRIKELESNNN